MSRASENALIETISPHEQMETSGRDHYFHVGRSAMACIQAGLAEAGRKETDDPDHPYGIRTILDLPCGQGRVLRNLRQAFPNAEITASDTSREGVDFCAETFGAVPVYSCDDPEEIALPRDHFDLIWVGSLLTHLDIEMWRRFLKVFHDCLSPGGLLIFTTHGRQARNNMATRAATYGHDDRGLDELVRAYDEDGYGHIQYDGMDTYYGTSISTTDWVVDRILEVDGLRLVMQQVRGWDGHQDCFTCRRGEPRRGDASGWRADGRSDSIARRAFRLFSTAGSRRVRVSQ